MNAFSIISSFYIQVVLTEGISSVRSLLSFYKYSHSLFAVFRALIAELMTNHDMSVIHRDIPVGHLSDTNGCTVGDTGIHNLSYGFRYLLSLKIVTISMITIR